VARTTSLEWLETNGLGGWAASTVAGAHSRRYHGLLVAATRPPVERTVLLAKLDETIEVGSDRFDLGSNIFGTTIHPRGHEHLEGFARDLFPRWTFAAGGVRLERTIAALDGENTTVVHWSVTRAPGPFVLELRPFVAARNFHALVPPGARPWREAAWEGDALRLRAQDLFEPRLHEFFVGAPGATFVAAPDWWREFHLAIELERGFDGREDLWTPGVLRVPLGPGSRFAVVVSVGHPRGREGETLLAREARRREAIVAKVTGIPARPERHGSGNGSSQPVTPDALGGREGSPRAEALRALALAADQFIVRRGSGLRTVIAGYHWFGDWGRDTMIALPVGWSAGLRRATSAARRDVDHCMLLTASRPRRASCAGGRHAWFFVAVLHLQATRTRPCATILPCCATSSPARAAPLRHGVDEDGLLCRCLASASWMDAKVGDSW
jgi:glycogen debranching enzyme